MIFQFSTLPRVLGDLTTLHADTSRAAEILHYTAETPFCALCRQRHHPDPSALLEEKIENWTLLQDKRLGAA